MKPAIKIENLSKQYRLGLVGTGTLSHDLKRWWYLLRGKEDPYLKIGEINDRSTKGSSEYVWALKDINLEVMPGEVLGIIGKNGAGKSTLLKILSKVTGPTTGTIDYKGRIGSLLEVGTGFHPELTGRENIYLNGAILGMRKKEIDRKFDEIVDFSGVERYIDTPTKRYSSGMTVRLGFAVAAFLEPEILVVDEVLAVGDAEFQKKAIGKMQDVSRNDGRTVLFVSHNMGSIKRLCKKAIVLNNGNIIEKGLVGEVINHYLACMEDMGLGAEKVLPLDTNKDFQLLYACLTDENDNIKQHFSCDEDIIIKQKVIINKKIPGLYGFLKIVKKSTDEDILISDSNDIEGNLFDQLPSGENTIKIRLPKRILGFGEYLLYVNYASNFSFKSFNVDSPGYIIEFSLTDSATQRGNNRNGYLSTILEWNSLSL
ncbi:MAG: polysaccharide ABC transporter ATP-binding protein [Bacteroidales bacterium]|nr:polysaccharide ABC transporter ATP-binding protein [Bacteroidales bacterium]